MGIDPKEYLKVDIPSSSGGFVKISMFAELPLLGTAMFSLRSLFADHRRQGPKGLIVDISIWENVENLGVDEDDVCAFGISACPDSTLAFEKSYSSRMVPRSAEFVR